jgi:hypothetical protein
VLDPAARRIAAAFPGWWISIGVPIGAVQTGVSWSSVETAFEQEVIRALTGLHGSPAHVTTEVPGLFEITIHRRQHRVGGCFIGRYAPKDDLATRAEVISRSLTEKARQLAPYAASGMPTVLLLDNDDLGLMEPYSAAESFRRSATSERLTSFTEIYLVDSTETPPWFFPLKLGERLHPLPEFERFHAVQVRLTYDVK